ncbi:CoA transferase [Microbacterium sp.]|uniref:CoA transferase n=1 Tax=Microbacterium sp. TaxID=51671 RepID=UPI003A92AB78
MNAFHDAGDTVLRTIWTALDRDDDELLSIDAPAHPVPLPAHTDVPGLAWGAVAAASAAAASLAGAHVGAALDPDRVAVAYASDRVGRLDGVQPTSFAPLSGFFRSADGWVRTHGNYPHHAAALQRGLGLPAGAGRDEVTAALAGMAASYAAESVTRAGGLCVAVAPEAPAQDEQLRAQPIVAARGILPSPPAPLPHATTDTPLRGIRVLDLTRVIAGPVGTRTLALLGADVLRLDPPQLPELGGQHLDTGHGKRTALLDLSTSAGHAVFDRLLQTADVVALGYRPAALARLGLSPQALARRRPGLVVAQHSAWGDADRRGFDSLVQAASGIAVVEGSADAPGVLPAQALDHTAGYLLAAGVLTALARRAHEGGSWLVTTSLRRIAAELLGLPRVQTPAAPRAFDSAAHTQDFDVAGHRLTTAAPALAYEGGPRGYAPPRPWGGDAPAWRER